MVSTLSSGCSISTAASTAVRPRLMPWPSIEILGGRYSILRRDASRKPKAIMATQNPTQPNGKQHPDSPPTHAISPLTNPISGSNGEGRTMADAGTTVAGNEAPTVYCVLPTALAVCQVYITRPWSSSAASGCAGSGDEAV